LKKLSDDKTIGVGIVGAGFARTTQIPGFRNCKGARVVAITSRHREHAASVAQEFGIEHVANDWKDLVARDDIDLVSVVTPPATTQGRALRKTDGDECLRGQTHD